MCEQWWWNWTPIGPRPSNEWIGSLISGEKWDCEIGIGNFIISRERQLIVGGSLFFSGVWGKGVGKVATNVVPLFSLRSPNIPHRSLPSPLFWSAWCGLYSISFARFPNWPSASFPKRRFNNSYVSLTFHGQIAGDTFFIPPLRWRLAWTNWIG